MDNIYKVFFERAQEAILVFAENGIIKSANPKAEELFGYTTDELRNTNITALISKENREEFLQQCQKVISGNGNAGNKSRLTFWGENKNGNRMSMVTYIQNHIRSRDGVLIMAEIIDESRNTEDKIKLTESENRFSEIFYSSPSANVISQIDDGKIIDLNDNFIGLAGYPREALMGHNFNDLNLFANNTDYSNLMLKLITKKEIKNYELIINTKNGNQKHVLLSAIIINLYGRDHALGCIIDITENKKAEEELKQTEERFSKAFGASPAALAITSITDGVYIDANKSFLDIFGYAKEEIVGQSTTEFILFNDPGELEKLKHHLQEYGNVSNFEITATTKKGSTVIGLLSMETIRINSKEYILSTILDITEKKKAEETLIKMNQEIEQRAEEKLRQSEEIFFKIFELSPVPVALVDAYSGKILNINPASEKLYCYEKKDIVDKTWLELDFIEEKTQDDIVQIILSNNNKINNIELKMKMGDGTNKDVLIISDAITIDKRKCFLITSFDFSERKKAEESMRLALEKEKESNEMKSRFVSMASHQFRTPLAAILSSIDLVGMHIEKNDTQKCIKHLHRIKSSVSNLTGILNDFLSLDKLENGKTKISKETVDLKELALQVIEESELTFKAGQHIRYTHQGNRSILQDKMILQNILLNLLSNASKYSGEGKKIELATAALADKITISVKDSGIGIPANEQAQIFSRLFRARNAEMIAGNGLGLNIVKRYVELLNGTVNFNSTENEGSTFVVEFPV